VRLLVDPGVRNSPGLGVKEPLDEDTSVDGDEGAMKEFSGVVRCH
jgi:hypothetical protein